MDYTIIASTLIGGFLAIAGGAATTLLKSELDNRARKRQQEEQIIFLTHKTHDAITRLLHHIALNSASLLPIDFSTWDHNPPRDVQDFRNRLNTAFKAFPLPLPKPDPLNVVTPHGTIFIHIVDQLRTRVERVNVLANQLQNTPTLSIDQLTEFLTQAQMVMTPPPLLGWTEGIFRIYIRELSLFNNISIKQKDEDEFTRNFVQDTQNIYAQGQKESKLLQDAASDLKTHLIRIGWPSNNNLPDNS